MWGIVETGVVILVGLMALGFFGKGFILKFAKDFFSLKKSLIKAKEEAEKDEAEVKPLV